MIHFVQQMHNKINVLLKGAHCLFPLFSCPCTYVSVQVCLCSLFGHKCAYIYVYKLNNTRICSNVLRFINTVLLTYVQ